MSVSDQNILNGETEKGLEDLRDSGVNNIEFEKFFNEVYILTMA